MADACPDLRCDTLACELSGDGVAISLEGRPFDASDEASLALDGWQFVLGEGPLVEVGTGKASVEVPAVGAGDVRWLRFAEVLASHSVGSVFSFPMSFDHTIVGALTMYRSDAGELSQQHRRAAHDAARAAGLTVAAHVMQQQPVHRPECGVRRVDLLNQAIGVVMHDVEVGPDEARARIRSHAFSSGTPIEQLVNDLVARRQRLQ